MVPYQTIPPSEPFGWKDFFDSLKHFNFVKMFLKSLRCLDGERKNCYNKREKFMRRQTAGRPDILANPSKGGDAKLGV